ncbi:hypothetical protein HDU96_005709 [Phlyctochytrium bullatum]|nr:hypothetical protein HDU96_005709 [Phlyctochytrium bullatum]
MSALEDRRPRRVLVVMGVSGSGKSTVGRAVFDLLGSFSTTSTSSCNPDAVAFLDADDFHSKENIAKMASGTPLTDEDRMPWLASLATAIHTTLDALSANTPVPPHVLVSRSPSPTSSSPHIVILACSALKRSYRTLLKCTRKHPTNFAHISISPELLTRRLASRSPHFFDPTLLHSQLATLEPPTPIAVLDATVAADPNADAALVLEVDEERQPPDAMARAIVEAIVWA